MKKHLKIYDVLVLVIVFISAFLLSYFSSNFYSNKNLVIMIKYYNKIFYYPINEDRLIKLKDGKIEIEIKNRKVRIKKNDCREKICILTGWISKPGEVIICVPNHLIIKIIGKKSKYDSISK